MIPIGSVQGEENGLFVYRVLGVPLAVRNAPDAGDGARTALLANPGDLFAADQRRQGRSPGKPNGPFLRLSGGEGWLFEKKYDERYMEQMHVEVGLWCYRVNNEGVGLALRVHPTNRDDLRYEPYRMYPHNMVVWVDRRVEVGKTTFVHVQGASGWLFTRHLGGQQTLLGPCEPPPAPTPASSEPTPSALSLPAVRRLAAQTHGLKEVGLNEASRVISFTSRLEEGTFRLNVYYTTGTVGTCLEHPRLGKTQLFRRSCTLQQLAEIMDNPRAHTGKGYYRRDSRSSHVIDTRQTDSEERELRLELQGLDEEMASIISKREAVLQLIHSWDADRAAAAKDQMYQSSREREASKTELKEAERARQAVLKEASHRGRLVDHGLQSPYADKLNAIPDLGDASCISLGTGYFVSWGDGRYMHSGLPTQLHNKITSRQKSLPKPEYVATDPENEAYYYVRFADGKSYCVGPSDLTAAIRRSNRRVNKVAFGSDVVYDSGYYSCWVVVFADGLAEWHRDTPPILANILATSSSGIRDVTLGADGEWFVIWDNMHWSASQGPCINPSSLWPSVERLEQSGGRIRLILFGDDRQWLIRYS